MAMSRSSLSVAFSLAFACGAIGATAAPAAAASPRVAFVQGIRGKTVDVCIGGNEVRSNLKYGKWFQRTAGAGSKVVKFRMSAPGACTGSVLGQKTLDLAADDDLTIVVTRSAQKVLDFDNTGLGDLTPSVVGASFLAVRQAADLGGVSFKGNLGTVFTPTADPVFTKGDQWLNLLSAGLLWVAATRPRSNRRFASTASELGGANTVDRIRVLPGGHKGAQRPLRDGQTQRRRPLIRYPLIAPPSQR